MTYGQIRFRCSKLLPGMDPDLLDGWLLGRYQEILDVTGPNERVESRSIVQTYAPYETGTVTVTEGSAAVTGTGTAWTSEMTGLGLRMPHTNEFYEFTYVSATSGTLDRAYEGATGDYSYKLFQSVYVLPADCGILLAVSDLQHGPLASWSRPEAAEVVGGWFGAPQQFRRVMDHTNGRMQVEVWPIPDEVTALAIDYIAEDSTFGATTASTLASWVRPQCLTEGVYSDGLRKAENFAAADRAAARFAELLGQIRTNMIRNMPPKPLRLAAALRIRHR